MELVQHKQYLQYIPGVPWSGRVRAGDLLVPHPLGGTALGHNRRTTICFLHQKHVLTEATIVTIVVSDLFE